jgi:hypothetical protein
LLVEAEMLMLMGSVAWATKLEPWFNVTPPNDAFCVKLRSKVMVEFVVSIETVPFKGTLAPSV